MGKKFYRVPLIWQMWGYVWVEAYSKEDAIDIALGPDTPLPDNGSYIDESVEVDDQVEIQVSE